MHNFTLRQFRAIQAIHRHEKIINAAKVLGLTGPAVTLQLKQMEEEAGLTLFDRTGEGLRPTAAGLAVLETAETIDEQLRVLADRLDAIAGARTGSLRLGAVSTAKYFVPRMIAGFLETHPDIDFELKIGNRLQTIEALRHHEIDIAVMGRPPRDIPVRAAIFGDHPLVIVARADHALAGRHDITKEMLAREHFLIRERGSGTRISLEMFFADLPQKLEDLGAEMDSNETIKQAVIAGLGIAFISAHTIEQELQLGRLVILDVAGMPIRRQWFSVTRRDRGESPTMATFNRFLLRDGPRYLPVTPKPYPAGAFGISS